jgi:FAD/FMN-containing dehydrogenase/Fe-S oxidoreductase
MTTQPRIREIPYNYTSFSDREIVIRLLGEPQWQTLNQLRGQRRTGRSARMLFEVLGDIWVIQRNPFIQDDLLTNRHRRASLIHTLYHRLEQIELRANGNQLALQLAAAAHNTVKTFEQQLTEQHQLRHTVFKRLAKATRKDNICFDGFSRVSHVTDATDWRVEYPFVVIFPDTEAETAALVAACIELKLTIIPRGGGTGYTGGAIPLQTNSAVINIEKLDNLGKIKDYDGNVKQIRVGAGVITQRVAEKAAEQNNIFAVDPTSQNASTIGGNIAMNAGGKKAVQWGTTLDNLLSWRLVTPTAEWLEVERLNHSLGKIQPTDIAEFRLTRYQADGKTPVGEPTTLRIPGNKLRKPGLGKDVTNKYLEGLPGIQKEGCDGLITSAVFILHPKPKYLRTVCLEFFGTDLKTAVPAIVETKAYLDNLPNVLLTGMEHLDERYLRAVKYSTKAPRQQLPKMLLLIDIAGNDDNAVAHAASEVVQLANARQAEGFIAVTPEAQQLFWQDRARVAAIAAHTNAFKINEDVVIPLARLADYNDAIERINIEQSTANKLRIIDAILDYLQSPQFQTDANSETTEYGSSLENDVIMGAKRQAAQAHLQQVRELWQILMDKLDTPASDVFARIVFQDALTLQTGWKAQPHETVFTLLQRRVLRISYRQTVAKPLKDIFRGGNLAKVRQQIEQIHATIRTSRLFVALHMHAGDGNVHTNIPVFSNDYEMLQQAEQIVARIMTIVQKLGGVISGEHGIGMTKLAFLAPQAVDAFIAYKQQIDPNGHFNQHKLQPGADLQKAYTPSLRLLEQEALILEASELGELNTAIKDCLRCGKCKPVCNTHVPRANLLYSPRNKILATGLMIEAFLYEEQTRRGISLRHFDEMNNVADHCTICHKCLNPCPVNIDFGEVTIKMRTILKKYGKRQFHVGKWAALSFLNITNPTTLKLMRKSMLEWGYKAQRLGYWFAKQLHLLDKRPAATAGKMRLQAQVINFVKKPLPSQLPKHSLRSLLGIEDHTLVPIVRDPAKVNEDSNAVFYFPGCGSERLFSQVGLATLAMLYQLGTETVLAPGYLCCGYPQNANGDTDKGKQISTANQVLFHRVANTLNYLEIKTVIVSCGTCMDQLLHYQFQQIFPGCRLLDIHEYLMEKGIVLNGGSPIKYLYHDPCHTPMKSYQPLHVASRLMGQPVLLSERCCGEAGTFAVARPDIATQVRFRKLEELQAGVDKCTQGGDMPVKVLTACPACLQGLSRYRDDVGIDTDYLVVELASQQLGQDWQSEFLEKVRQGGIERVLL